MDAVLKKNLRWMVTSWQLILSIQGVYTKMVFIHNGFWRSTLSKTSGGGQKYKSKVSK
jgi:hypothetical protein